MEDRFAIIKQNIKTLLNLKEAVFFLHIFSGVVPGLFLVIKCHKQRAPPFL